MSADETRPEVRCPHCRGPLVRDHNSESCDECRRLWPIGYLEGQQS